MFFLGVGSAIIGAASRNIGLSPFQIGLLLASQNIGFILSVITVGTLADSADKARLLFAASLILAVSFFFFYLKDSFILNLGIMLVIGVGIGGYEGASDAMLLDIHERRQSLFINVNHFFVTLGQLMIVIYLIFLQMDWRKSMVQSAVAVFVLAIIFGFSRVPSPQGGDDRKLWQTAGFSRPSSGRYSCSFSWPRARSGLSFPLSELFQHCSWIFMDLTR